MAETYVAWREEVWELRREFTDADDRKQFEHFAADLLDDYPLKPHELLREPSYRAFKHFESLAKRHPLERVWLLELQRRRRQQG